jgi:hypothetical protein
MPAYGQIGVVTPPRRRPTAFNPGPPRQTPGGLVTGHAVDQGGNLPFAPGTQLAPGPQTPLPPPPGTMIGHVDTTIPPSMIGRADPGGRWDIPDYVKLLANDPLYIQARAHFNADLATAGLTRRDAIRRAIVQAGFAPVGWQSGFGDVDPTTLAVAAQNPQSTLAQLTDQRRRANATLQATLASRGTLSSGALTGGLDTNQRGFESGQYTAGQQLLDALSGYQSAYTTTMQQLEAQLMSEQEAAAQRIYQNYQPQWVPSQLPQMTP